MKKATRTVALLLVVIMIVACGPAVADEAGWRQSDGRWWYSFGNGTYAHDQWYDGYYFDSEGWMATGWVQQKGVWYYLDDSGLKVHGWRQIDGVWYYFNDSGAMKTGWLQDGGKYYLTASGAMQTGWLKDSGKWYFFDDSGLMKTGWVQDGGDWYFMNSKGVMQTGKLSQPEGTYNLGTDGRMKTGWVKGGSGQWYYHDASGLMMTGWFQDGRNWYYFYNDGQMAINTTVDGWIIGSDGVARQSTLSVDLSEITLTAGETDYVTFTFTEIGSLYWYCNDIAIVSPEWAPNWENGTRLKLYLTGNQAGTTTVKVTNSANSDTVTVKVKVLPGKWTASGFRTTLSYITDGLDDLSDSLSYCDDALWDSSYLYFVRRYAGYALVDFESALGYANNYDNSGFLNLSSPLANVVEDTEWLSDVFSANDMMDCLDYLDVDLEDLDRAISNMENYLY